MTELDYKERLRLLRLLDSQEKIANGSVEHAAAIIEEIFIGARESVKILTRRLSPEIFAGDDVVEAASVFAALPNRKVKIIVESQNRSAFRDHPLFKLARRNSNIEVRGLAQKYSSAIDCNFAIMDKKGLRFEKDKTQPIAVASFNAPEEAKICEELFDAAYALATRLS